MSRVVNVKNAFPSRAGCAMRAEPRSRDPRASRAALHRGWYACVSYVWCVCCGWVVYYVYYAWDV